MGRRSLVLLGASRTISSWLRLQPPTARRILVCTPVLVGLYVLLGLLSPHEDPLRGPQTFFIVGLEILTVASLLMGVTRSRPGARGFWKMFVIAQVALTVSSLASVVDPERNGHTQTVTAFAAVSILGGVLHMVFVIMAIVGWIQRGAARRDPMAAVDLAIVVTVSVFLSWIFVILPVMSRQDLPISSKLVLVSFPLLDVVAFGLTVRVWFGMSRAGPGRAWSCW